MPVRRAGCGGVLVRVREEPLQIIGEIDRKRRRALQHRFVIIGRAPLVEQLVAMRLCLFHPLHAQVQFLDADSQIADGANDGSVLIFGHAHSTMVDTGR